MPKIFGILLGFALFLHAAKSAYASVKINEFLAHPSSENKEWVEFYNPDNIDLSTYYLDDDTDFNSDSGSSGKKSLSTYNNSSSIYPFLEFDSFLNNSGDYVVLFSSDGTVIDQYQYLDDPGTDTSIGRSPDGSSNVYQLSSATKGSLNGNPQPSPAPSPQPSPTQASTNTKSPSPTPKVSPSPSPQKSPSPASTQGGPSPKKSPESVLGEKEGISPSPVNSPSTSPSPDPSKDVENQSKTKIAAMLTGTGAIIIGASFGFFLWYKRVLESKKEGKD